MTGTLAPGLAAAGAVVAVIGSALAALIGTGPAAVLGDAYLRHVVLFTLAQAALSTGLAVGLAIPVARALAHRRFPGRSLVLRLFGVPLVLPVIVAVFGIVAVYGQSGYLRGGLGSIYGLAGIVLAHVFFNLPLAARSLLSTWSTIPGESWRLATQLGMSSFQAFRFIEAPLLRQVLPGIATLVFFLCFTSFATVLTLGGGPGATVLEVAIYQALRVDFDLPRAGALALIQLGLCATVAALLFALGRPMAVEAGLGRAGARPPARGVVGRLVDTGIIVVATGFVVLPIVGIVARALGGPLVAVVLDADVWAAAGRSVAIGAGASVLAVAAALAIAVAARELRIVRRRPVPATALDLIAMAPLATSILALGAGLFALLHGVASVFDIALPLVVVINGLLVLPYAYRLVAPASHHVALRHGPLCRSLGIAGWNRLRLIEAPALRAPVGLALALGAAMAAGDLGAIALFGTQDTATLPLLLYQRMASYRMDEAAVIALLLVALTLVLFVVVERVVGGREHR